MARVWFVRRQGGLWVAPGGVPAYEMPLSALIFPLDIGTHRLVTGEAPVAAPALPAEAPQALTKVLIEAEPRDLTALEFSGYVAGVYDSPYSPAEAARRLDGQRATRARASA